MLNPSLHATLNQSSPLHLCSLPWRPAPPAEVKPISLFSPAAPSSFCRRKVARRRTGSGGIKCGAAEADEAVVSVTKKRTPTKVKAVATVKLAVGGIFSHVGITRGLDDIADVLGRSLYLELLSTELDAGKLSELAETGLEKKATGNYAHRARLGGDKEEGKYESEIEIEYDFGEIGAVLVTNEHHKEIYLKDIVIHTIDRSDNHEAKALTVHCHSWVHSKFDNKEKRIFFATKSYLPSETPSGLRRYREKELALLRGDGTGERKTFERIYDYDVYNDLGDPDADADKARPILGGSKELPYPRRCRTGRDRTKKVRIGTDPLSEKRGGSFYIPRDEAFSEVKNQQFSTKTLRSVLHALVPSINSALVDKRLGFPYFTAIDSLFNEGISLPSESVGSFFRSFIPRLIKVISEVDDVLLRFEIPEMMDSMTLNLTLKFNLISFQFCVDDASYLPSETPSGLRRYREKELALLRGDGTGERKTFERIYDYDVYNDLGDPDADADKARPILGGSKELPYPRRCRTGRDRTKKVRIGTDPLSEKRGGSFYIPRDEAFSEVKNQQFSTKTLRSVLHALVPSINSALVDKRLGFPYFTAIDSLFNEGISLPSESVGSFFRSFIPRLIKVISEVDDVLLRFEIPEMMDRDKFSWFRDEEFSRQTLAGVNPLCIQLIREFPIVSKLDPDIYGPAESGITKEHIEREIKGIMTVEEALKEKKLFILDYHDVFLPFVHKVRQLENTTLYASRTVFFLTPDDTLRPIFIELTRPKSPSTPQWRRVFSHCWDATGTWLWRLARAHVGAHDSGFHQLVSHWLRTHSAAEPYIIAANRQLSALHPIYRLLHPHFRFTMEINALAREYLISAGGIIEVSFSPERYSMELSSAAYDQLWRFDMEALPADLVRRGMAVEDPSAEHGLRLTIKDYPYAADGLLVWSAIKQWVTDYVSHYYSGGAAAVSDDNELQAWWSEIRNVGHGDKKDEPWWPELDTPESLIGVLTTIIWTVSGHHAAVNFGQYHYAGYFPNRPTVTRINLPVEEGEPVERLNRFLTKPESVLLESFPSQIQATVVMSVLDILSCHSPDEEYLGGEPEPAWAADPTLRAAFVRFSGRMKEIEGIIDGRNADMNLKNRCGAGIVPYELFKPFSDAGVTGKGVPNSISI
ncbi:Linoleate 13S-lipoxygenase 2-1, chloroplastic [Apostasia shenzhenica]|uniref:Lipoxygenase n=1 Tax=Apostasia shenzhenica TaxID=1088818 RepID=A0A2I0B549_9ASPA|nr:Linoleate 13S-lipoxygenase 2-1, chloroplastic [Apostasia shenzhenica]